MATEVAEAGSSADPSASACGERIHLRRSPAIPGGVGRASREGLRAIRTGDRHSFVRPDGGRCKVAGNVRLGGLRVLDRRERFELPGPSHVRASEAGVPERDSGAHASWLNQIEIYFSIVQRKVFVPNDCQSLADRLLVFQDYLHTVHQTILLQLRPPAVERIHDLPR